MKSFIFWWIVFLSCLCACTAVKDEPEVLHGQYGIIGSFLPTNDQEIAREYMERVFAACKTRDSDALIALFSQNTVQNAENLEENIASLFDFFHGSVLSYDDWGGPNSRAQYHESGTDRSWEFLRGTYDVVTENGIYRFAVEIYIRDTAYPENLGIHCLYVTRGEDTDMQYAYWGDGAWTQGITIE